MVYTVNVAYEHGECRVHVGNLGAKQDPSRSCQIPGKEQAHYVRLRGILQ